MIYLIPLEPLEERYTEQWSRWIPEAFKKLKEPFKIIKGRTLTTSIETGFVLDAEGTNYYKFTQLQEIMAMLREGVFKDNDTLLFYDLWFPGIEAIAYSCAIRKLDLKIVGVLHAGTYDINDFTYKCGMREWGRPLEQAWMNIYDAVFLGSKFHKELINSNYPGHKNKLCITYLPFKKDEIKHVKGLNKKEKIVVFPHRLDPEKQPEKFDELEKKLRIYHKFKDYKFIKSMDVCKTKEEYYQLLARSEYAVSFSQQETFGIAMLEAYSNKCKCFVPNRLSYHSEWKNCYTNMNDLVGRMVFKKPSIPRASLVKAISDPSKVVKNWIKIINKL